MGINMSDLALRTGYCGYGYPYGGGYGGMVAMVATVAMVAMASEDTTGATAGMARQHLRTAMATHMAAAMADTHLAMATHTVDTARVTLATAMATHMAAAMAGTLAMVA